MAQFPWGNADLQNMAALGARPVSAYAGVGGATSDITTTNVTDVLAAPGASVTWVITSIVVTNAHATVGTFVKIIEETSGTILARGYAGPGGGGFSVAIPLNGITLNVANKKVQAQCETSGAQVCVTVSGYKAPNSTW